MSWCGSSMNAAAEELAANTCTICDHVRAPEEPTLWGNSCLLGVANQRLCFECYLGWYEHGITQGDQLRDRSQNIYSKRTALSAGLKLLGLPEIINQNFVLIGLTPEFSDFHLKRLFGNPCAVVGNGVNYAIVGDHPGFLINEVRRLKIREIHTPELLQIFALIESIYGAPESQDG